MEDRDTDRRPGVAARREETDRLPPRRETPPEPEPADPEDDLVLDRYQPL